MESAYDVNAYPSGVYPQAQISRLATVAALCGMRAPDLSSCRVLEVGCNRGLHLINMALRYPGAQFVGIDVSETAIARATEMVEALELANISFRVADLTQLSGRYGECDYLIAHGVYSWVAQPVREKLLELAGRVLAENGLVFISLNVYPGWHIRGMVAEMMRMHTEGVADPRTRHKEGVAFLATLLRSLPEDDPYRSAVSAEAETFFKKNPMIAWFDEFSAENSPVYFTDFMRHAAAHGLQYVSDTDPVRNRLTGEGRDLVDSISDPVMREQYIDFFQLARFREVVLCRDAAVLDRSRLEENLTRMYFGLPLSPAGEIAVDDDSQARFVGPRDLAVTVTQPFIKAALLELVSAWPGRLHFDEIELRASARSGRAEPESRALLASIFSKMLAPGLLEADITPYPHAVAIADRPVASRLARIQAAANGSEVVSFRHTTVEMDDEAARVLLRFLDGTRDRQELLETLRIAGHPLSPDYLESVLKRMLTLSLLEA
jgi:SAM-dependent methyltransferase